MPGTKSSDRRCKTDVPGIFVQASAIKFELPSAAENLKEAALRHRTCPLSRPITQRSVQQSKNLTLCKFHCHEY